MYLKSHFPSRGCGRKRRSRQFGLAVGEPDLAGSMGTAFVVVSAVLLSVVFLVAVVPQMWWLVTIYGWIVFPAFRTLAEGLDGTSRSSVATISGRSDAIEAPKRPVSAEQQILEALERNGELTPTKAALETSLSVAEAEKLLVGLADGGYLEVRVRDGGLFYSMWSVESEGESREP